MSDARGGNQVFLMVYVYFRLIGSFTFLSPHIVHVEVNAKFANFSVIIDVGMVLWHRMCSLAYSRGNHIFQIPIGKRSGSIIGCRFL